MELLYDEELEQNLCTDKNKNYGLCNCFDPGNAEEQHSCTWLVCCGLCCGPCLAGQVEEMLSATNGEYADKNPPDCYPRPVCCAMAAGEGVASAFFTTISVSASVIISAILVGHQTGNIRKKRGETRTCLSSVCDFATGLVCQTCLNCKNYRDAKALQRADKQTREKGAGEQTREKVLGNDNPMVVASQPNGVGLLL